MKTIEHWNGAPWIGGASTPGVSAPGKPKPIAERTFTYLNGNGPGQGGAA